MSEGLDDASGKTSKDGDSAGPPLASSEIEKREDSEEEVDAQNEDSSATGSTKKKKKKSKKKLKEALAGQNDSESSKIADSKARLNREQLSQLAEANPSLKEDLDRKAPADIQDLLKKLSIGEVVTGMV